MVILKIFPQKVLDCGEIKILADVNMDKKSLYIECWSKNQRTKRRKFWNEEKLDYEYEDLQNDDFEEAPGKIKYALKRTYEDECMTFQLKRQWNMKIQEKTFMKYTDNPEMVYNYLGIKPYVTSVMINISPNWKGKFGQDKLTDKMMTKKFCQVIDTYLKASNRYSRWKYVLECGSEGNHLHAHIVAEFNKKCVKSVTTHINKGNHTVELRKIWDKIFPEGYVGLCKGKFSIHRIILRNEELRQDKLNYLIEDLKPEGHKNKSDLGILVNEGF